MLWEGLQNEPSSLNKSQYTEVLKVLRAESNSLASTLMIIKLACELTT